MLKISPRYLFMLAGTLILMHPILLAKNQADLAYQLSIGVFLVFLSALIISGYNKLLIHNPEDKDSRFVSLVKNNFKIKVSGFKIGRYTVEKKYSAILLACTIMLLFWKLDIAAACFGTLFLVFFINKWDSRVIAALALISLSSCPVLLVFNNGQLAETMAIYAYYFLVLTVVLQIIEYRRDVRSFGQWRRKINFINHIRSPYDSDPDNDGI
jgi:hypothetical protein